MSTAQLIQTQCASPGQSVSVWKEDAEDGVSLGFVYRKVWQSQQAGTAKAWLSWAHHEHLVLTLLAHREAPHVVQVAGLQLHPQRVEVVTHDAGPEFRRDWLSRLSAPALLTCQQDALKLTRACLRALHSVHASGVVHGDFKADNLCIQARPTNGDHHLHLDLRSLRLIDFAYAVYLEQPLKYVLPTDPDRLEYLPDFYRLAIRQAQSEGDPAPIQRAACAQVDLFSLLYLLNEVVPNALASDWTAWQAWLQACIGECTQLTSTAHALQEPTQRLLDLAEKLLKQLQEPSAQWDDATTSLPGWDRKEAVTPLLHAQATPMLTPLIVQALNEVPAAPLTAQAPGRVATLTEPRQGWRDLRAWSLLVVMLALAGVFAFVDRQFVQTGAVLTDVGFVLGLLAMVMAPLLLLTSAWCVFAPKRSTQLVVCGLALGLCGIAVYFLAVLYPKGVSGLSLGWFFSSLNRLPLAWLA